MQNHLSNNNKVVGMNTSPVIATILSRYHFGDNYTAGIMVHEITQGVVVNPIQKATTTI